MILLYFDYIKIGFKGPKTFNKVLEKYKHKSSDNQKASENTEKKPQTQEAQVHLCIKRQQKKSKRKTPK